MHIYKIDQWRHPHRFNIVNRIGERNTNIVIALTAVTMVVEIIAGMAYGSMALLADGWHMATHVAALAITVMAYRYARIHSEDTSFSFGTGKVVVLGGFASAVALAVVALLMAIESTQRLFDPRTIQFNQAIFVACIGLVVNIISAFLLHSRSHKHVSNEPHHHVDHNLKAAYLHVMADALTSFLAIIALFSGKLYGLNWMDPIMGIVGGVLIARWSLGLLKDTSSILLDRNTDPEIAGRIRSIIESDSDNRISDLHIWSLGSNRHAAIISIVTHFPKPVEHYKSLLAEYSELAHVTVETHHCMDKPCLDFKEEKNS